MFCYSFKAVPSVNVATKYKTNTQFILLIHFLKKNTGKEQVSACIVFHLSSFAINSSNFSPGFVCFFVFVFFWGGVVVLFGLVLFCFFSSYGRKVRFDENTPPIPSKMSHLTKRTSLHE